MDDDLRSDVNESHNKRARSAVGSDAKSVVDIVNTSELYYYNGHEL
jgi:hypothetical protein